MIMKLVSKFFLTPAKGGVHFKLNDIFSLGQSVGSFTFPAFFSIRFFFQKKNGWPQSSWYGHISSLLSQGPLPTWAQSGHYYNRVYSLVKGIKRTPSPVVDHTTIFQ